MDEYQGEGEYCCFVSQLEFSTTEDDLMDAFNDYNPIGAEIIKNIVTDKSEGIGYVYFNEENEMKAAIKEMNHKCLGERLMVVANDPLATWNYQDPCGSGICRLRCNGVGGMNGEECFKCGLPGHLPKECKIIIKAGRNRDRGGRRGCFKCGKPGHLAKDCQISGS